MQSDLDPADLDPADLDPAAVEAAVRRNLVQVLEPPMAADDLALAGRLVDDYGLSSLNRVLFLTQVCDDTGVPLSGLTEIDLARMTTVGDVIDTLVRAGRAAVTS